MNGGGMIAITPVSGAPVTPGVTTTEQPIVTGGPGMNNFLSWRKARVAFDRDHRALHRGAGAAVERGAGVALERRLGAGLDLGAGLRLNAHALSFEREI